MSHILIRPVDTANIEEAADGLSSIWTDPEGTHPLSRFDQALGKLAEEYGAPGWVDEEGAEAHSYTERAAVRLAEGFPYGATFTDADGATPSTLLERALGVVSANSTLFYPTTERNATLETALSRLLALSYADGFYAVIDEDGRITSFSSYVHSGLEVDGNDRVTGLNGEKAEVNSSGRWVGVAA